MSERYNAAAWLLDRNVELGRGGRAALRCRGETTTYEELLGEAWRVQNALRELGIGRGKRVAMVVNDEAAFPAWFLGAQRSGVVPVPLSTMLTAGELAPIVADAQARALVVSDEYADRVEPIVKGAETLAHVVVLGNEGDDAADAADAAVGAGAAVHRWASLADRSEAPAADTERASQAFWLYSSGTTGAPKGVMHVHASLQATADTYAAQVLEVTPEDRFFSVAKLFFAFGLGNSLTFPFSVGATAVLEPSRPTPAAVAELVAREQPSLFFASPGFVAGLLDAGAPAEAFASVRATVTAGESLPADLQRRFSARMGHPVLDGIGSTEALHIFISNTLTEQTPGASGRPVPGYEVELRDDEDRPVTAPDTPGYLHVRGPSTAVGYWQRPDATAAAFRDGALRTGDVYVRSAEGVWTFLGRNNDMIKAGGIWVSPAEVEGVLIEHPDVLEAAVVGARNESGLETTVAFVVPASGAVLDLAELTEHCRARMAAFKRPREVHVVAELPKTATGKIRRFALRETLEQR
ncbi:MAG: benzoate-CoA ligase family protein [Acidimicrobiales bacterium]